MQRILPAALFLLLSCLVPAVHAAALNDEEKNVIGPYVIEPMAPPPQAGQNQCQIYLMQPQVDELEGIWFMARPRVDDDNLTACDTLGVGYAFAWSYQPGAEGKLKLAAATNKARPSNFMEFKGKGTPPLAYSYRPQTTQDVAPAPLVLRKVNE